mmetsp:Transcript_22441/g.49040  ORF Transcript_22441/g.49040 Transcript_22441/m.49040 type:complete len:94 (-) Transcript_22441:556-837(-)
MGAATKGGALRNFGAIFQNKGRQTPVTRLIVGFLSTALWMLFSSALIILNKNLYRMGFQYPFFVTVPLLRDRHGPAVLRSGRYGPGISGLPSP